MPTMVMIMVGTMSAIVVPIVVPVMMPRPVGMNVVVFVGVVMLVVMSMSMPVAMTCPVGVNMFMGITVLMVVIVVVGMATHGDFLSGLKIKDGGAGPVPTSAMSAHQATSVSSSILLIFSSSPCNRSNRREPQAHGVNSVSVTNSVPQALQRARPSICLISSVAP